MNKVLSLQNRLAKLPFGKSIFSWVVAGMAPYFKTIKPQVIELRPNYMVAKMTKRRAVHNHIKTVHAIASCNLCEFTAGICMEASIPSHRRWIPTGMNVSYLKKAKTDLTATCDLSYVDWQTCEEVACEVSVLDLEEQEVVRATIFMKVSDKK